jgi:hypothetical protein
LPPAAAVLLTRKIACLSEQKAIDRPWSAHAPHQAAADCW